MSECNSCVAFYLALSLNRRYESFFVIDFEWQAGLIRAVAACPFGEADTQNVGAVEVGHERVGSPLLMQVATDDDGATQAYHQPQHRQNGVALHARDNAD